MHYKGWEGVGLRNPLGDMPPYLSPYKWCKVLAIMIWTLQLLLTPCLATRTLGSDTTNEERRLAPNDGEDWRSAWPLPITRSFTKVSARYSGVRWPPALNQTQYTNTSQKSKSRQPREDWTQILQLEKPSRGRKLQDILSPRIIWVTALTLIIELSYTGDNGPRPI